MAKLRSLLLDTGPVVAYLDVRDPAHSLAAERLEAFAGRLHTTSAVLTEAMYFLSRGAKGPMLLAEFVVAGGITVHDYAQPRRLLASAALMAKYADTPMDYADATLVLLAEDAGIEDVATFDRRGFATYRTSAGKPFRILGA